MPSNWALRFIASTHESFPPGYELVIAEAARFSEAMGARCSSSPRVRLAQLAREPRARNDRQCKERHRDEPHPSSHFLVGPASLALAKLICNENNRIRVTLHTSSRKWS